MPTLIDLAEAEPVKEIDGLSFLPTLLSRGNQLEHDYLYWEFHEKNGRRAVRRGDWKLVQYDIGLQGQTTTELFDLEKDPSETLDLAGDYPAVFNELKELMLQARTSSPVFEFVDEQYQGEIVN
jgi:arylsulfatase A-like enzyme